MREEHIQANSQLMGIGFRHQCLIYEGPPSRQLPALAAAIKRKLEEGHKCMYLNSRPMVDSLRSFLSAIGVDVEPEIAKARLVLSSKSLLSANGDFDIDLMLGNLEGALDQALGEGYKGLWATGDMTWEFGTEKNFAKLKDYEYGLEELMLRRPELSGICQYHQDAMTRETALMGLLTHPTIFINDTLSHVNPDYVPPRRSNKARNWEAISSLEERNLSLTAWTDAVPIKGKCIRCAQTFEIHPNTPLRSAEALADLADQFDSHECD